MMASMAGRVAGASSAHRRASPLIGSDLYNVREALERGTGGACRGTPYLSEALLLVFGFVSPPQLVKR